MLGADVCEPDIDLSALSNVNLLLGSPDSCECRRQLMRWNPEFFNQFSYIPGRGCGGFIPAW